MNFRVVEKTYFREIYLNLYTRLNVPPLAAIPKRTVSRKLVGAWVRDLGIEESAQKQNVPCDCYPERSAQNEGEAEG